jgi:hypothetical protein
MPPSLRRCLLTGSLGFAGASVLVFATVAFAEKWMYQHLGLPFSYGIWTLLFMLSGWAIFNTLVAPPVRGLRFFLIFSLAFLCYAAGWISAYFLLRGAAGEWCGSLAGSVLMGCVIAAGFRSWRSAALISTLLLVTNSFGYFVGSAMNTALGGKLGMLLWGVVYGLCLGAGIGAALHHAQRLRERKI